MTLSFFSGKIDELSAWDEFFTEKERKRKKVKKLLKNVKKQLTKGSGLWYYRQAHDREGVASDCSQRKGSLKTE